MDYPKSAWILAETTGLRCGNCSRYIRIWPNMDQCCVWRVGYKDGLRFGKNLSMHYSKDEDRKDYLSGYYVGWNATDARRSKYNSWKQLLMFEELST